MSVTATTDTPLAWPARLAGLLLIAALCLSSLNMAQASAGYDPYSHTIDPYTAVPVSHAPDHAFQWDSEADLPARLIIKRVFNARLHPASPPACLAGTLTAFSARAPPASAPTQVAFTNA